MALFSRKRAKSDELPNGQAEAPDANGGAEEGGENFAGRESTEYLTPPYLTPFPDEADRIGLIAGGGQFPILLASAARSRDVKVTAFAIKGFALPELASHVDAVEWIDLGALNRLIDLLKKLGLSKVAMVGRVPHQSVLQYRHFDTRMLKILASAINKKADTLLELLCRELSSEGIEVLDSTHFMKSFLPEAGMITKGRELTERERDDIEFGLPLARQIAGMDIGQAIAVKDRVVVAVEGIEGTDGCIARAGQLGGEGVVIVKVSKPNQDRRFDVPVIGRDTIRGMIEGRVSAIAISAREALVFDRDEVVRMADEAGIAIAAVENPPWPPKNDTPVPKK
jgi:DUF1009 family protein